MAYASRLAAAIVLGAVGCTKTQRLAVAKFDPSSMQTAFAEEAPAKATYIVQLDRPGKRDDEQVESTRVRVLAGTPLGFQRAESGVIAFAGGVRFELPTVDSDTTLSWNSKRKVPTKFARVVGDVGAVVVGAVIDAGVVAGENAVDKAIDRAACDPDDPKQRKRHHHRR